MLVSRIQAEDRRESHLEFEGQVCALRRAFYPPTELQRFPGSNLVDVTVRNRVGLTSVFVVVKSPHPFTSEDVGHMNDSLNAVFGEPVDLHMRSEIAVETTRDRAAGAEVLQPKS
jgi:hypothetical protein